MRMRQGRPGQHMWPSLGAGPDSKCSRKSIVLVKIKTLRLEPCQRVIALTKSKEK